MRDQLSDATWAEQQTGRELLRGADTEITRAAAVRMSGQSARSPSRAARRDTALLFDGHVLTQSYAGDEQEDTHSPLLFGRRTSKLADLSGVGTLVQESPNRRPSIFCFFKKTKKQKRICCSCGWLSAGSQSQPVAVITFSKARQPIKRRLNTPAAAQTGY